MMIVCNVTTQVQFESLVECSLNSLIKSAMHSMSLNMMLHMHNDKGVLWTHLIRAYPCKLMSVMHTYLQLLQIHRCPGRQKDPCILDGCHHFALSHKLNKLLQTCLLVRHSVLLV